MHKALHSSMTVAAKHAVTVDTGWRDWRRHSSAVSTMAAVGCDSGLGLWVDAVEDGQPAARLVVARALPYRAAGSGHSRLLRKSSDASLTVTLTRTSRLLPERSRRRRPHRYDDAAIEREQYMKTSGFQEMTVVVET
jgi:hypothetical protein